MESDVCRFVSKVSTVLPKRKAGCGLFDATNASKHSINQSEDRILQINQKMLRSIRSTK